MPAYLPSPLHLASLAARAARRPLVVTTFLAVLGTSALASARLTKSGDAEVTFSATGPAGLSIVGTTHDLAVQDGESDLIVTVPLANLDTKIALRNKHMREKYLETAKYPNAELKVAKSQLKLPTDGPTSGKATGTITIHGQSRPTTFTYTARKNGAAIAVDGKVHVNLKDHGIEQPGYAGVSVKPDVDVRAVFALEDR